MNCPNLGRKKSRGNRGRRQRIKGHLEVRVEIGEADGGGVLDGAVGLAPALHRRHSCAAACSSSSALFLFLSRYISGLQGRGTRLIRFFFSWAFFFFFCAGVSNSPTRGVKMNKARAFREVAYERVHLDSRVTTFLSWFTSGRFET